MVGFGNNQNGVVNLSKGAKINLSKETPGLKEVLIGLGWNTNKYSDTDEFDLDASVFLVNKYGKTSPDGFIFYNRTSDSGRYEGNTWVPDTEKSFIVHTGDNRTGEGDGDDESILINLDRVPLDIEKIAITVTIHEAKERKQSFGLVENSFCRLVNKETDKEVVHFDLGEDFSTETAIVVAELYRHNGDWKFNAIGKGFKEDGLLGLCRNYGLEAEYR